MYFNLHRNVFATKNVSHQLPPVPTTPTTQLPIQPKLPEHATVSAAPREPLQHEPTPPEHSIPLRSKLTHEPSNPKPTACIPIQSEPRSPPAHPKSIQTQ